MPLPIDVFAGEIFQSGPIPTLWFGRSAWLARPAHRLLSRLGTRTVVERILQCPILSLSRARTLICTAETEKTGRPQPGYAPYQPTSLPHAAHHKHPPPLRPCRSGNKCGKPAAECLNFLVCGPNARSIFLPISTPHSDPKPRFYANSRLILSHFVGILRPCASTLGDALSPRPGEPGLAGRPGDCIPNRMLSNDLGSSSKIWDGVYRNTGSRPDQGRPTIDGDLRPDGRSLPAGAGRPLAIGGRCWCTLAIGPWSFALRDWSFIGDSRPRRS